MDFVTLILGADTRGLGKGRRDMDEFATDAERTEARTKAAMNRIGAAVTALAAVFASALSMKKFIQETVAMEKAQAQLAAVLKSTGNAAGKTIKQLNAHAAAMQKVTSFGDDATSAMQGLLLTFINIKGTQFDRATEAVIDLATAMGTDLNSAALQVGKALNDPVLGMTALSRSGIQFTEAQKEMVKKMVATNNVVGAQTIILAELERQFGGSAKAARATLGGALTALGNAWGDLFEITGPSADRLRLAIEGLIATVSSPGFVAAVQAVGAAFFTAADVAAKAVAGLVNVVGFLSDTATAMGVVVMVLAATQLPALMASLAKVVAAMAVTVASTNIMTIQFGLGAAASIAMTTTLGYLRAALILVGGPIGLIVGAFAALAAAVYLTRPPASEATLALKLLAEAQGNVNTATDNFSKEKSMANVTALKETALAALNAASALLTLAEADLANTRSQLSKLSGTRGALPLSNHVTNQETIISKLKEEVAVRLWLVTIANNQAAAITEVVAQAASVLAAEERTKAAAEITLQLFTKRMAAAIEAGASGQEILKTMQAQNVVAGISLQVGQDSVEAVREQNLLEQDTLRAKLEAQGINGTLLDQIISQLAASQQIDAATKDAATAAANMASSVSAATGAASGFVSELQRALGVAAGISATISSMNFSNIARRAQIAALQAGQTSVQATATGDIAQKRAELTPLMNAPTGASQYARAQLEAYSVTVRETADVTEELTAATSASTAAMAGAASGAGAAGAAVDQTRAAYDSLMASLDPVVAQQQKLTAAQQTVNDALASGSIDALDHAKAMTLIAKEYGNAGGAVDDLTKTINDGLLNAVEGVADAIGKWASEGFKKAQSMFDSIKNGFRKMLADIISMAIANPIKLALGIGGSGPGGVLGDASGTGIFGSLMSGLSAFSGGIGAGFNSVISALGSGGLTGAIGALKTSIGGATAGFGTAAGGMAGLGTAIGAIAAPVAAVVLLFNAFKTTTKTIASGLQLSINGLNASARTYTTTQKSSFFGLFKSTSTSYGSLSAGAQGELFGSISGIQQGVVELAGSLGFAAETFESFSYSITAAAGTDINARLIAMGDAMAGMVTGLTTFAKPGEGAVTTLQRLSSSALVVTDMTEVLGMSFEWVGLVGADLASKLVDAFGGLDAMSSAVSTYYQAFYTDAERLAALTLQTSDAFEELGLAMPTTRDSFRALVEAQDITTAAGQRTFVALIKLADTLNIILPSVANLTAAMAGMVRDVTTEIDAMIDSTNQAQRSNAEAAVFWYRASQTLRDLISRMRGTVGALTTATQAQAFNEAQYQMTLAAAMAGDKDAAQRVAGSADMLLDSAKGTARTAVDLARVEARVLSDLSLLSGVSNIEGARHDVIAGLLGEQVDVLAEVRDHLTNGGALDAAQIGALNAKLGSLESAITAAADISYARLQERIDVTVDILATADIPSGLRKLLAAEQRKLTRTVDFIARSSMTGPEMFLAVNNTSEHVKTVDMIVGEKLPAATAKLALATSSSLDRTLNLIVGAELTQDQRQLALAANSELSRTVNAVMHEGADQKAIRLALANVGAYEVAVNAALGPEVTDKARKLVFGGGGSYSAMVTAAVSADMPEAERRILLLQQGDYAANITGILTGKMSDRVKDLLLKANTEGVRALTIAAVFAEKLTPAQREALRADGANVLRTVTGAVDLADLSSTDRRLLNMETSAITRTINGIVTTNLTPQQATLLAAINGAADGKITLGGSFLFDPTNGFKTWYEETTKNAIINPMTALVAPMDLLQASLTALAAAIRLQMGIEEPVIDPAVIAMNAAQANLATLAATRTTAMGVAQESLNAISRFDAQSGGDLVNARGDQVRITLNPDGTRNYNGASGVDGNSNDIASWKRTFWAAGGLEDQSKIAARAAQRAHNAMLKARAQVISLGGVPAFAQGGTHMGGLRIVGEQGPELEATGVARYYSADQTKSMMGRDGGVVAAVDQLRREVAGMREEQRQLGLAEVGHVKKSADTLRKWDVDGLPAVRV